MRERESLHPLLVQLHLAGHSGGQTAARGAPRQTVFRTNPSILINQGKERFDLCVCMCACMFSKQGTLFSLTFYFRMGLYCL